MSNSEPYLLVEKCGASRGKPIYVITKHIPSVGTLSSHPCSFHRRFSSPPQHDGHVSGSDGMWQTVDR